jgi:hypothetical protein
MVGRVRRVRSPARKAPSNPAGSSLDGACVRLLPDFSSTRSKLASAVSARRGAASTSQGHPRTIFRRALERGNLVLAEVTAREIGRVTIAEALELTALVARKPPHRYGRFAARWLCLYLEDGAAVSRRATDTDL